jgi:hypothetical protein
VVLNSSTYIDGAIAAANLGLPHIWSIHEMQQNNPEQSQGGVAEGAFARWFAALSDHQIFCSDSTCVAQETVLSQNVGVTVLPPFLESINDVPLEQAVTYGSVTNLMFIGLPLEEQY